jgi:ribonucleoside-diphosphate reductase alpha chain/ribonucleoside-diphosphate reductase subunit M1
MSTGMKVQKRNGDIVPVLFDKVVTRLANLCDGIDVQPDKVAQKVFTNMYDGIKTSEIDELSAEVAVHMQTENPAYEILATRIVASNMQKMAPKCFSAAMVGLHVKGIVSDQFMKCVSLQLDTVIVHARDFDFGYFGLKTLQRSYLNEGETPQYLFMRVAVGIHGDDVKRVIETYDLMSQKFFTHATPTLFNAGTNRPQMSSCFVAGTPVFTTNRGPVPIEQVQVGDSVITHTGAEQPVQQTHKNLLADRTLFDVKVNKTPGFKVTGNHRFWSITKEQLGWNESPQWNSIDHLRVGDWISIPRSNAKTGVQVLDIYEILKDVKGAEHWTYSFEFSGSKVRRNTHFTSEYRPNGIIKKGEWFESTIPVDKDFAWFLGAWYGDGCIMYGRSSTRNSTHRGIAFAQNPNNTTFIDEIVRIGEKYLGVHACVSPAKDQNCVSISFNNSAIGNAFNILFGRWSSEKFLWPGMFAWDRDMVTAFIGGLVSTDGCCTLNGGIVLQLTNQPLIQSIFHLSRSVGLDTSMTIMTKPYNGRATYIGRMQIPWIPEIMKWVRKHYDDDRLQKIERASSVVEIDGHIFLRINAKTKVTDNLPEFVYTLGVKDDHSYSVQGLIAENCFLVAMKDDSIEGIYDTLKECAQISKWSGGIGIHCSNIRANGTVIKGTNGKSDGIVPMLRVFNNTARYVNQGGGKRKGSFAFYLEPWHADVMEFLELRLNQGDEEARCRDLFTAMWVPDLFMEKVEKDEDWHLMCPDECPGLPDVYGEEFNELYRTYVAQGRYKRVVKARTIWDAILKSQIETGTPYMGYKDSVNKKSNQKNIGVIKSSNLCHEILEVSTPDETAVCNLASLSLPAFAKDGEFDFDKLCEVTRVVTRNLNRVIDKNYYPTEPARKSNMRHRPIGIGVQGLADVYMMLGLSFDEPEARKLNKFIFETIYYAALMESRLLATEEGPYETFDGSPASQGVLQFDMWNEVDNDRYAWDLVKAVIMQHGLRNSLLVAPMPTASTAQILGNNEAFEPYTTNIYLRRTLAGEFVMINRHLVKDLQKLDMWNPVVKNQIIRDGGSVQSLDIPDRLKEVYRTVWEIPQKSILDMAADRGAYIDQSQSMNIFMENPTLAKLSSMHMYGWRKGLKTGMYYLRTRAKAKPQQVTLPPVATAAPTEEEKLACSLANPEGCLMCSG